MENYCRGTHSNSGTHGDTSSGHVYRSHGRNTGKADAARSVVRIRKGKEAMANRHTGWASHVKFRSTRISPVPSRGQTWELRVRHVLNMYTKEMLKGSRPYQVRFSGNSPWPRAKSGDVTLWEPVTDHSKLKANGVVCCEMQPHGAPTAYAVLRPHDTQHRNTAKRIDID